ncbi:MAG: 4Fe-4S dicluster domain-containing protein [Thermodesulfovibrionales bacterium]|nr:4Fe-4S dicluster domain-containing protein [Thermodesulfovibrionales bacterium]
MSISRRQFLGLTALTGANLLIPKESIAKTGKYASIIDLTRCDGCKDEAIPRCVSACKNYNQNRYPEPVKPIQPYWPRKNFEDWSEKRDKIDTLTPYNWIFVQRLNIEGQEINIPRRCMHCDNPPCVRGCPFGALSKQPEGNSVIDDKLCFGGAKCRDVCPWAIPQRQAGVGIYLKLMPKLAGGGVMYKCDMCKDKIRNGQSPECVSACKNRLGENTAMFFGDRKSIYELALKRAKEEGLYLYGNTQNGGTSTLYLSKIPFEKIEKAITEKKDRIAMKVDINSKIQTDMNPIGKLILGSSVASIIGGITYGLMNSKDKGGKDDNEQN